MAQIWLTYVEIGEFFSCSAATARDWAIESNWSRRRSRDGQTRAKLPHNMMGEFISRAAAALQALPYKNSPAMLSLPLDEESALPFGMPLMREVVADVVK
jgi:hypothetical protein